MASARVMRGAGGLTIEKPTMLHNKIQTPSRDVRASAEPKNYSNVVVGPQTGVRELATVGGGLSRKQQLQMEVRRALEEENNWWRKGEIPANMVTATSPKHFKSLILNAPKDSVVVSYFFSPTCNACRTLYPKFLQIAKKDKNVLFVRCNTAEQKIASLAEGLHVSKIPWFVIFSGGPDAQQMASFTANLGTIDTLRAEIAGATECTDEHCWTN